MSTKLRVTATPRRRMKLEKGSRPMTRRFNLLLLTTALLSAAAILPAMLQADEPPEPPAEPTAAKDQPAAGVAVANHVLVAQLGDDSYRTRERATALLESRGIDAAAAIRAGLRSPLLEVRMRCDRLLSGIAQRDLVLRLQALLDGNDKRAGHFPGWEQFKATVGSESAARKMYVDIYKSEQAMLDLIRPKTETLTAAERAALTKSFDARLVEMRNQIYSSNSDQLTWMTFTAMLLVAADPNTGVSPQSVSHIYTVLIRSTTQNMFNQRGRSTFMKKVLSAWIEKASNETYSSYYTMNIALRYKLPLGVKIARNYVSRNTSSSLLSGAILAIARNGDKKDLPLLTKHLANRTVCHTHTNGARKTTRVQVRDVALASIIHINGKDPAQFGYPNISKHPETVFAVHTLAFENDAQRDAARKLWDNREKK